MRIVIFSGTSEGHALCRFLSARGAQTDVFVATAYGEQVIEPLPGVTVHTGRLTAEEMTARLDGEALTVDLTPARSRPTSARPVRRRARNTSA